MRSLRLGQRLAVAFALSLTLLIVGIIRLGGVIWDGNAGQRRHRSVPRLGGQTGV